MSDLFGIVYKAWRPGLLVQTSVLVEDMCVLRSHAFTGASGTSLHVWRDQKSL